MASMTELASSALATTLQPGESVICACKAHLDGGTMRLAKSIAFGPGSGFLAADGSELAANLANGAILVVTVQRLIVMSASATSFKPKKPVLEVDRARITDVTMGEKKVMFVRIPTMQLELDGGNDSSVISFEIPKAARRDFEAVTGALLAPS